MDDSLRVLLATPDYPPPPGGIQTITRNLERGLRWDGHEVLVLHVNPRDFTPLPSDLLPRPRWLYEPKASLQGQFVYLNTVYRKTASAIESFQPDVVHAMHVRNWPALVAANERDVPTVLSTYALELEERTLAANAIAASDVVHAISEFTASLVRDTARKDLPNIILIPPSIDIDAYRNAAVAAENSEPGPVITIARFVDRKNVETVIEAWKRLPTDVVKGRELVIAGDGPNRAALEERVAGRDNIQFPGWVNGRSKRELLARADAFAMVPRRREFDVEGFGIVYIEAQAADTPVVGSKHGGAPEAIDDAGILVNDENDPDEVAAAIELLLVDDDARTRCLSAARDRINNFNIPTVASRHVDTYRQLVDE